MSTSLAGGEDEGPGVTKSSATIGAPRLGFGTAALMSRVNRRDSVRLLETALDCGITHFDTARSYGFGEAETVLADLLTGRRDRLTVTTKVGILPPRRRKALSSAKAAARALLSVMPALRPLIRRGAGQMIEAGRFDSRDMQDSLDTSLRQLRTDYVDVLLLHEPSAEVLLRMEPLSFLQRVQREGKVRAFGMAAAPDVVTHALRLAPEYAEVVQVPHSVFAPCSASLRELPDAAVFTHSPIGSAGAELHRDLRSDAGLRRRWSERLGLDVSESGVLEGLLLRYAARTFPTSTVLFASTRAGHIRENAAAFETAASAEQLQRLEHLVNNWSRRKERA